jgi:hypothetical protein
MCKTVQFTGISMFIIDNNNDDNNNNNNDNNNNNNKVLVRKASCLSFFNANWIRRLGMYSAVLIFDVWVYNSFENFLLIVGRQA